MKTIRKWWADRQRKKRWSVEEQVRRAQVQNQQDSRWLSEDPVAAAICQRYQHLLADDWEKQYIEPIEEFRARLRAMRAAVALPDAQEAGKVEK